MPYSLHFSYFIYLLIRRVNFQRIIPKSSIFKSSEVFKQLNEEARKTKAEKETEQRKWTTFLQRPDRPVPKTRDDLERECRVPYKVNIVKQPKPRCDPTRPPTPPQEKKQVIEEPKVIEAPVQQLNDTENTVDAKSETTTVSDNIESVEIVEYGTIAEEHDLSVVEDGFAHNDTPAENEISADAEDQPTEEIQPEVEKSPEDILLETQLAAVQKQLLALSNLPSTIQATLDAVAKQLQELVPAIKSKTAPNSAQIGEAIATEKSQSVSSGEGRR